MVALPLNEASIARGLILGGVIWALIILGVIGIFMDSSLYWILGPAAIALAAVIFVVAEQKGATVVRRWTAQLAALLIVLAVGIALPGSAIYFSAGVDQLVQAAYMDGTIPKDQLDLTCSAAAFSSSSSPPCRSSRRSSTSCSTASSSGRFASSSSATCSGSIPSVRDARRRPREVRNALRRGLSDRRRHGEAAACCPDDAHRCSSRRS